MLDKFEIIENEVKIYKDTVLDQNPNFAPRMGDIYKLIDLFSVSKFRDGDRDSLGFRKVFFNIGNFIVDVCAKMLDLDTKDIFITAEEGQNEWTAWLLGKELKMWMKNTYFARKLNEWGLKLPKYGDLWVKKVKSDVMWIPPQNMIFRVNATDYKTIPLIEKHEYGADELRIVGKQNGWENIEDVINAATITPTSPINPGSTVGVKDEDVGIVIYEAWFPKGYLENEENNWFIISKDSNKVLAQAKKDCPYKKLAWEEIPGRLAGRGRWEQVFEEQIYLNRIANYKSSGFHWTSKHWYQAKSGSGIEKNLMTEADDGEIVLTNSEITPIVNEERNLQAYGVDEARWTENVLRKTFTTEPVSGQRNPSGTTLGATVIQTQQTTAFYKQKKEELAEFIKEILMDWVLPEFAKEANKEHKLFMKTLLADGDSNSEKFFQLKLNERMNRLKMTSGYLTPEQWEIRKSIQAEILKKEDLDIPKGFYDNLKYKINIRITGEELDVAARQSTINMLIQMVNSNPAIFENKRVVKFLSYALNMIGMNPKDFFDEDTMTLQNIAMQRGGSISAPATPTMPAMQPVSQTL
jgi:hypothetical protein